MLVLGVPGRPLGRPGRYGWKVRDKKTPAVGATGDLFGDAGCRTNYLVPIQEMDRYSNHSSMLTVTGATIPHLRLTVKSLTNRRDERQKTDSGQSSIHTSTMLPACMKVTSSGTTSNPLAHTNEDRIPDPCI